MNPILIYTGSDVCYNTLNIFAREFGKALSNRGAEVIYYDVDELGLPRLAEFAGRKFSAIVGFQTYAFDVFLPSRNLFLHDLMEGPKFNFCFDHPVWMRPHLEKVPHNFYVLTHDRDYMSFVKEYYPNVKDALLLPPGGIKLEQEDLVKTKDLVFVGTYSDYRNELKFLDTLTGKEKELATAFYQEMKDNPNATAEASLEVALSRMGQACSGEGFLEMLDHFKHLIYCVMFYYREKVVSTILDAGISINVYGDSWKESPFTENPLLNIRPAVYGEDYLKELAYSKLSLNIMAWHKDGFTERIANSMLQKSVVVSDASTCLQEQYVDGEEIVLFDLAHLNGVPARINELLRDDTKRNTIANNAYKRAYTEDTWESRAELFLDYLSEIE